MCRLEACLTYFQAGHSFSTFFRGAQIAYLRHRPQLIPASTIIIPTSFSHSFRNLRLLLRPLRHLALLLRLPTIRIPIAIRILHLRVTRVVPRIFRIRIVLLVRIRAFTRCKVFVCLFGVFVGGTTWRAVGHDFFVGAVESLFFEGGFEDFGL